MRFTLHVIFLFC